MALTLALVWASAALAAYIYASQYGVPGPVYWALLPALLAEISLYTILGVEKWRTRVEAIPGFPGWLILAGVAPYVMASLPLGSFSWVWLGVLAALVAVIALWFVLLPEHPAIDILFLAVLAAVVLTDLFERIYVPPHAKVPLKILGQLMWIRTGAFALLSVRKVKGVGFGFIPSAKDWKIGVAYFVVLLPIAGLLAWWLGFASLRLPQVAWWKASLIATGTFLGMLWVVALGEEFFFRGLLQQWLGKWFASEWTGLIIASILFGSVHLPFRTFPNWRFAILASVAGLFYGLAFRQAKSIRASMVTHALTATTWRVFFAS